MVSVVVIVCVIVCVIICVVSCCVNFTKIISLSDLLYNVWSNNENNTTINSTLCLSPSCSSAVVDCYLWFYSCVGQNDNNGLVCWSMMMFHDANLLGVFVVVPVSICTKDKYYTIITNIYVQLGDAVDCSIIWWYHVGTDDSSVTTIHDDVISVLYIGCDKLCFVRWEP